VIAYASSILSRKKSKLIRTLKRAVRANLNGQYNRTGQIVRSRAMDIVQQLVFEQLALFGFELESSSSTAYACMTCQSTLCHQ
jgi:hypothetical protein